MSLSIEWATKVITIPQSYLTPKGGSTYELDVNAFRLDLKSIEDDAEGMVFLDTHRHNTEVTVGGMTLARVVEIINGYTVTFEDGQYIVNLVGANNNISDVTNLNQVSIRSANSAGMITVVQGSGVTQQDKEDIIGGVWTEEGRGVKLDAVEGQIGDVPAVTWLHDSKGAEVEAINQNLGNHMTNLLEHIRELLDHKTSTAEKLSQIEELIQQIEVTEKPRASFKL